ncbi:MAG: hypothetical protein K940chlam3_01410 [Chlamydiae bacterium]|nr:hypothetical protein [Chlamydiota bacterium]
MNRKFLFTELDLNTSSVNLCTISLCYSVKKINLDGTNQSPLPK